MEVGVGIVISIILTIIVSKIMKSKFRTEKIKKQILAGENIFLSKDKDNLRIGIGVVAYIFIMVAFAETEYYAVMNILVATIFIYLVVDMNKMIKEIYLEDENQQIKL